MDSAAQSNGSGQTGTARVKRGMAEMLKGGVIMDVVTPEQARIAEGAGAVAVMALERVPADIRAQGGVSRMSDPDMIEGIIAAVTIPVMAKARIGHFVEAQILQSLGVDYIDESEVLTPADYTHHIDKWKFTVPFVCGATNLGEALRRISEGAAMIRSKGEAGTGDVSNATTHMRAIGGEIRRLTSLSEDELYRCGKGIAGALRAGRRGGPGGQAAGHAVHRGRHRHSRRRGDDDAARRRGRLRRLGHLQVRRTRRTAPPRSSRPPPSTTTPMCWPRCRAGWASRWWASTWRRSRSRIAWPSAAGKNSSCRSRRSLISSNSRSTSTAEACSARIRDFCSAPSAAMWRASRWCRRCAPSTRTTWCTRCTATSCGPETPRRPRFSSSSALRDGGSFCTRRVNAIQHGETIFSHVGVLPDRSGGHQPPGRHAGRAAAGRPAGAELDQGVRRRRIPSVRGVGRPHRAAERLQLCPARPPSSRCGSATATRCPTTRCCTSARWPT